MKIIECLSRYMNKPNVNFLVFTNFADFSYPIFTELYSQKPPPYALPVTKWETIL